MRIVAKDDRTAYNVMLTPETQAEFSQLRELAQKLQTDNVMCALVPCESNGSSGVSVLMFLPHKPAPKDAQENSTAKTANSSRSRSGRS